MVSLTCTALLEIQKMAFEKERRELWEAAEFEGRVAAKLANIHFGTEDCEYCSSHIRVHEYCGECHTADNSKHCQDCRLKAALLQVEEEMDNEKR